MSLNQILGVAAGALPGVIVGVTVGVVLDWYRTRKEDQDEKRRWYASMRMLAKQAEQITNEAELRQDYLINSYGSIESDLRKNILNAPVYDEEVSVSSIKLAQDCLKARDKATRMKNSTELRDKMDDATEFNDVLQSAHQVREKAESAIEKI